MSTSDKMNRRTFIKSGAVAGITGSAVIQHLYSNRLFGASTGLLDTIDIPSPYLNRLVVKPVMTNMYHTGVWEGPCRWQQETKEQELANARQAFESFRKRLANPAFDNAVVTFNEPGQIFFIEDFVIREEEFSKIDEEAKKADVLYISPIGCSISNYKVAARYNKPVVLSNGISCRTVDVSAYLRSHGMECHLPNSETEANQVFTLLKARKNFRQMRTL